ncbi:type VI secretion system contractile sheath large subunit, partial [bacterium]|nr:type VI secretion system contractile sheath large subunit [bacterium]
IFKLLVEKSVGTPGVMPWSAIIGDYFFKHSTADIELLRQIGKVAQAIDAPFIAGGDPSMIGATALCETPDPDDWNIALNPEAAKAWQNLKTSPEAQSLGLILPRFLLRLPYGENTSPCQTIDFEELTDEKHHDAYLWGNAAFLCACLLGNSFNTFGWDLNGKLTGKIEGLPMHVYRDGTDPTLIPCGETILTDRAGQVIRKAGLIPLFSLPETDSIYLAPLNALDNSLFRL